MSLTDNNTSRITMLGTGNAMCVNCYNTCFYLHSPKGGMLVDGGGGNGILQQLIKAKIPFESIRNMFVTHSHTDHILGAIWMMRKISPMIFKGKHKGPFSIYCNDVVKNALYTMGELMIPRKIFDSIGQTIILREVHDGETVDIDDMKMTFFDIASTKVKQYGFEAKLPDGQSLVCLGDEPYTMQCEPYARNCDWLMCEAFCLYKDRFVFNPYEKSPGTRRETPRPLPHRGHPPRYPRRHLHHRSRPILQGSHPRPSRLRILRPQVNTILHQGV